MLGVVVALLTARMLAPGEDPGLLLNTSGPTNLLLTLLWLLAAVGLAGWRLWSRQGAWRGGMVEIALLVAAALAFASAERAGYKHPARLVAWEWLTLFVVVCLVRQLAVSVEDQNRLFAVFLAGAASLASQAVYQAAVLHVPPSATFADPGPFAGWLALFLPGLIAAVVVCRPGRAPRWQTVLTATFALIGAAAFVLAVRPVIDRAVGTNPSLAEIWRTTGRMILDRPLFGVGAENFSRAYPRFQEAGSGSPAGDPHNFALEIAATCGVLALLAVLTALGAYFVRAARWLSHKETDPGAAAAEPEHERTRWEYYIGGMCGLVLGLIVRVSTGAHNPDEILWEGGLACARCLVWLTAFIVFERVAWSGRARVAALTAGAAALLLVLTVSPGVGLPSVTVPLWAAVALGLNGLPQPAHAAINRLALTRILPVPLTALVALIYFLNVFNPVTSCTAHLQTFARDSKAYLKAAVEKDPQALNRDPTELLNASPLGQAARDDPDDARVKVLLALWTEQLWLTHPRNLGLARSSIYYARKAEEIDPQGMDGYDAEYDIRMEFARRLEASAVLPGLALGPAYRIFLEEARWPNPLGPAAVEEAKAKYREAVQAGKYEDVNPYEPAIQYMEAADVLERYLPNAPNHAALRFRLAETLFKAWEDDRCREQALEALRLDAASARPALTEEQRRKLNVWKDLGGHGG